MQNACGLEFCEKPAACSKRGVRSECVCCDWPMRLNAVQRDGQWRCDVPHIPRYSEQHAQRRKDQKPESRAMMDDMAAAVCSPSEAGGPASAAEPGTSCADAHMEA